MSSLSDMMSAAVAMMMSAAFVHFGVTGGSTPPRKPAPEPAAAHGQVSASSFSDAPVPSNDDRFTPAASAASATPVAHGRAPRRNP